MIPPFRFKANHETTSASHPDLRSVPLFAVTTVSQDTETTTKTNRAIRVTTALNHLTVLEFQEPVTLVAAGGTDFQIERQENKVFVKPLSLEFPPTCSFGPRPAASTTNWNQRGRSRT